MRAIAVFSSLFLLFANVFGQSYNVEEVEAIQSLEEAEAYVELHSDIYLTFLSSESKDLEYLKRRDSLKPGDSYAAPYFNVHIVAEGEKELYRFSLVSLNEQVNPNAAEDSKKALLELQEGTPFEEVFRKYVDNLIDRGPETGDLGWVDIDYFVESFRNDLLNRNKGDKFISHDEERGSYHVIEITHAPKKFKGHYALFYGGAVSPTVVSEENHAKNIAKLKGEKELLAYAKKYQDEVFLNLINEVSNQREYNLFTEAKKNTSKNKPVVIEREDQDYRYVKDTTVQLYSIQYIYIDGTNLAKEEKNKRINEIYNKFHAGTEFDELVEEYWPENRGMSKMLNVEGVLLAEDLVAKVRTTNVGELFVARVGQSYFIGIPLEKPLTANAYLLLTYPHNE